MEVERVALSDFSSRFSTFTGEPTSLLFFVVWVPDVGIAVELSSVALGGRIVGVSDEFFAEAYQLLLVEVKFAGCLSRAEFH